jgi:hypothetical protein
MLLSNPNQRKNTVKTIIYDIDGCCVDSSYRNEHVYVDFEKYLELHHTDKPILPGVLVYNLLMEITDFRHVFITGRGEEQREITEALLETLFSGKTYELLMRPTDDTRKDVEIKRELMDKNGIDPKEVFLAFDDRPVLVNMYRELGIVSYQTAVGY